MSEFLSASDVTAGPVGVPCTDAQVFALNPLYRDVVLSAGMTTCIKPDDSGAV